MEQLTVLIISDDPEFSQAVTARWQSELKLPSFTLMNTEVSLAFDPQHFQLAIVGSIKPSAMAEVLETLKQTGKTVLFLADNSEILHTVRYRWPGMLVLIRHDQWLETLVPIAFEALRRIRAEERAEEAQTAKAACERNATLGRYMLDMRHAMNNALTSVLGNSELLMLEPGSLSSESLAQVETIRNMALRIHEIMRRFSSLEKEMTVAERQSRPDIKPIAQAAVM